MKKLLICVAIASAVSYGVFEYANGKIEKEVVASLNDLPSSILTSKIENSDVNVNVLTGTMAIDNIKMSDDGREYQTNLKLEGIDYLGKTLLFKDTVKVEFKDLKVTGEDFVSDASFELKSLNSNEATFTAKVDTKDLKKNVNLDQVYKIDLKNMNDSYNVLNTEVSNLIRGETNELPYLKLLPKLSGVKVSNFNAKYKGSKFVNDIVDEALKDSRSTKEMFDSVLKGTLSDENYTPVMNFLDGKSNKVEFNLSNEKDLSISDIAQSAIMGGSPMSMIMQKYKLKVTN